MAERPRPMARLQTWLFAGIVLGVVLSIVGPRWTLIDRYGIDLPTWDEWDAQGLHTLVPWFQHRPLLPELLTPHNEHVVALTKLVNLGLVLANGQWDQRLECVFNSFLPAFIALAFLLWARSFLRSAFVVGLALVLVAAWGLPFAWHNTIAGFHSQQFFVLGLSFVAIAWLPFTSPNAPRWWIGALASALAVVSMASGFFAALIVLVLVFLRIARRETTFRATLPTIVVAAAISITGWLIHHEVPYHEALKAANVSDFVMTFVRSLQWPATETRWLALILWLPWGIVTGRTLFRRSPTTKPDNNAWLMVGLGGWVWLNIAATAYGRGAGAPAPSTRYLDTLVFGSVVNAVALGWLIQKHFPTLKPGASVRVRPDRRSFGQRIGVSLLGVAWIVTFGGGSVHDSQRALRDDLPSLHDYQRQALTRTRAYLDTRNPAYLESKDIPYPGADSFIYRLNLPELSRLLPTSEAPALVLTPQNDLQGFHRSIEVRTLPWNDTADAGIIIGLSKPSHGTQPPFHRAYWESTASGTDVPHGEWQPETAPTKQGWLIFALRNSVGATLEMRDQESGKLLGELQSNRINEWTIISTRAPVRQFVLRSRLSGPDQSLAFTEPVLIPTLSYVAWRMSANGRYLQAVGLTLFSLCAIGLGVAEGFSRFAPTRGFTKTGVA